MRMIKLGYVILKCFANYKSIQSVVTFAKKELEITDFLSFHHSSLHWPSSSASVPPLISCLFISRLMW